MIYNDITEVIGNTPLVKLRKLSPAGSEVFVKLDSKNPGGSIKDRPALAIINDAEATGKLSAGGTIIEPTSGNTGIAIAMIAAVRGYKCILVMPDTMSKERQAYMKAYGAEIVLTPGAEGMKGSVDKADEICRNTPTPSSRVSSTTPLISSHTGPELEGRSLPTSPMWIMS